MEVRSGRNRTYSVAFLLSLGSLALAGCPMRAAPGQTPLVGDIHIVGNHAVSGKDIIDRLALTTSGFRFIVKFGDAFPFDPDLLRVERLRIHRIYEAFGYYSARVTDIHTKLDKGRINITFYVDEGPATKVEHLGISGLAGLPPQVTDQVLRKLPLHLGRVFSEADYEGLKNELKNRLRDHGYWEATDEGHAVVDPAKQTADVKITVTTGPAYTISSVRVTGTEDVRPIRIQDASGLHEGEMLTPHLLADAQHKVLGMGVFAQALVKPETLHRETGKADVVIQVEDAPFQTVDAGIGVEADQTEQLIRARAVYTHKNLGIDLQRLVFGGSIGYAFLPTVLAFLGPPGTPTESGFIADLQLMYIQPRIFRWPIDANAGITYTKALTPAFAYQRAGAQAGLVVYFDPSHRLTLIPSLHYDYYFDVSTGTPQPTVPGIPSNSFATSGCGPEPNGTTTPTCSIAYVQARLAYDLRDDPLESHRGLYLSVTVQYASPVLGDFNYISINPEGRFFAPLTPSLTLATRINYGLLRQLGNGRLPPGVAHFFSGGATSVRAAAADQLGPREFVVVPNPKGGGFIAGAPVPTGGDHLIEGSVELRWQSPVAGLGFAVFFDIGRLQLQEGNAVPNSDGGFQYAPGIGVRYHTPFGPLRVDFAYRVSTENMFPVSVDTTNVKNPVASGVPTSVFSPTGEPNYRISTSCSTLPGQQRFQCYQDPRFQFFITLGEPF
jgi:translocation and assembly module TamA